MSSLTASTYQQQHGLDWQAHLVKGIDLCAADVAGAREVLVHKARHMIGLQDRQQLVRQVMHQRREPCDGWLDGAHDAHEHQQRQKGRRQVKQVPHELAFKLVCDVLVQVLRGNACIAGRFDWARQEGKW